MAGTPDLYKVKERIITKRGKEMRDLSRKNLTKAASLAVAVLMMLAAVLAGAESADAAIKLHVTNKNARKAARKVIKAANINKSMRLKKKFRRCYRVIRNYSYGVTKDKAPKNRKQVYKLALKTANRKYGKCYSYAVLTATVAKALGYKNVRVKIGKIRRPGYGVREHAWCTVGKRIVDGSFDNSYKLRTGNKNLQFFMRTKKGILKNKIYPNFNGRIKYIKVNRTIKI